ncbi:MAG: DMT family transporter [Chitinophagales bacterium]
MSDAPAPETRHDGPLVHALLFLTVLCWGMAFVFIKQGLRELTPVELTLLRFGLAGAAFALYLLFVPSARVPVRREDWGRFLLLGFLGVPGYHLALNFGEQWISASSASLIIALNPIVTALLSAWLVQERPGWRSAAGILLAVGGLLLVLRAQGGPLFSFTSKLGAGLTLFAAIDWSFYTVLAKPLFKHYPSATVTAYATIAGTIFLLPLLRPAFLWKLPTLSTGTWGALLFLSLLSAFFGYLAWYFALARRDAAQVAVYIYLNPLIAVLGSRFVLAEPLTLPLLSGGALILAGVAVAQQAGAASPKSIGKNLASRAGKPGLS